MVVPASSDGLSESLRVPAPWVMWPVASWKDCCSSSRSGGGDDAIHKAMGWATNCLNLVRLKQLKNFDKMETDNPTEKEIALSMVALAVISPVPVREDEEAGCPCHNSANYM